MILFTSPIDKEKYYKAQSHSRLYQLEKMKIVEKKTTQQGSLSVQSNQFELKEPATCKASGQVQKFWIRSRAKQIICKVTNSLSELSVN